MTFNQSKSVNTFYDSTCQVCGSKGINQYFSISDDFIDYNGKFYSLKKVLKDALDVDVR